MKKSLAELTKEDWNTLFPIELAEHNPEWKNIFENEKKLIQENIGEEYLLRIEHFGSTSVPGIRAKPYIDMLIAVRKEHLFYEALISRFAAVGYTHFKVPERENIAAYISFGKGYHTNGKKDQIFHLHVCPEDNAMWQQLEFRDYLLKNPKRAGEYELLKRTLAAAYKHDRGAYMLGKTAFIKETLLLATEKS